MPSIVPTVVAAEAMSVIAASAVMPISEIATPIRAVRIGRPPATNDPRVNSRMSRATAMPMISELPAPESRPYTSQLNSTCTPASRAAATAGSSRSIVEPFTSLLVVS
jgi:hypothetical protein